METTHTIIVLTHLYFATAFLKQYHRRIETLASLDQTAANGHSCRFNNALELSDCSRRFPLPPRIDASGIKHMHNHPSFDQLVPDNLEPENQELEEDE